MRGFAGAGMWMLGQREMARHEGPSFVLISVGSVFFFFFFFFFFFNIEVGSSLLPRYLDPHPYYELVGSFARTSSNRSALACASKSSAILRKK